MFIPIILGTNRKGRYSEHVAKLVHKYLKEKADTEIIDVADFDFPSDDYGGTLAEKFPKYKETIEKADKIIIVTPEYNHSFPGILKTLLDILYKEYKGKKVAVVGVSMGPFGGTRAIEALIPVLKEFGMIIEQKDLNFSMVQEAFDENGNLKDEAYIRRTKKFLDTFIG